MSASDTFSFPLFSALRWRTLLTSGLCALGLCLALCLTLCASFPLVAAAAPAETVETLAGRGEVRGAVSAAPLAAASSPVGPYDVEDQSVQLNGGPEHAYVIAGDAAIWSVDAAARRNTLTMNAGRHGILIAGQTDKGEAVGNKVIFNNGSTEQISGAYSQSGYLSGNIVEIHGGTVGFRPDGITIVGLTAGAYGEESALAEGNTVIITGGKVGHDIYGAIIYTSLGGSVVRDNHVVISGGEVGFFTYGGKLDNGDAYGNSVSLSGTGVAQVLIGGVAENLVEGNFVDISGGTAETVTGGISGTLAQGNFVTMSGGIVEHRMEGGAGNEAISNRVTISGGTVGTVGGSTAKVVGGMGTAKAQGNLVNVTGGEVLVAIHGGDSTGGDALENTVTIDGAATKVEQIVGGQSDAASATDNKVYIKGGEVRGPVIGGNGTIAASGNYVEMTGGTARDIYAGRSINGTVSGNSAKLSGGTVASVWGAYTEGGDARGNAVLLDGTTGTGNIVGGQSTRGTAADNVVQLKSGAVAEVYGGHGGTAATDNRVEMTGGTVHDVVVGGMSMGGGDASGNSVLISGGKVGGVAGSYVAGGAVDAGSAINNTVTLSRDGRTRSGNMPDLSGAAIYGGYDMHGTAADVFTGNTLNVLEFQGKARTVANFEQYNFFLPAHIANGSVVMQLSEATDISAPPGQSIRARITGMVDGGARLRGGDVIHLLQSDISFAATGMDLTGGNFSQGLTRNYDYELRLTADSLDAVILGAEAPPEVEAPTDGPSADGGLINGGGDLIAGQGMDNALAAARIALRPERSLEQANPWGVGVFGVFTGGQTRYNTPSRLSLASTHYAVGVTKLFDLGHSEVLMGAYLDAGFGSYTTQRKAEGRPAGADGDSKYYGGGVLSRYALRKGPLAGAYVEGSARTGLVESSYRSEDLQARVGREVKYDRRVPYYSAHGGLGYVYPISSQASVDIYGKFFWSRLERSTQRIAGDEFSFLPLDSYRLRGGARVNYALGDNFSLYAGAAYEHEFDGTPRARVDDMELKGDNMCGGTGIGELGLSFTLGEEGNFSMEIGGQGFIGKREGLMGTVRAQLAF